MATTKGLFGLLIGLAVAIGSIIGILMNSPFMTADPTLRRVYLWTLGFLLGVFIFGWGAAKLVGY